MRENKTKYVILGLLNHEDLTGYQIKQRVDRELRYFWSAGFGQIYPTLDVLTNEGYLSKRSELNELSVVRIIYSIEPSGRELLKAWLQEPVEKENVRYEILLKLFFGGELKAEENITQINDFLHRNIKDLRVLEQYEKNLRHVLDDNPDHLYYLLTVLFGKKVYQAYLDWAEEAIEMIKRNSSQWTD